MREHGGVRISVIEERQELLRVLHSPQFRRSPKLQRFLAVVCEYYFENRTSELKEFLIATEAFGKGQNFDPAEDSIVRVQARKVRKLLREYYEKQGGQSRFVIEIPVGSYAPVFHPVAHQPEASPLLDRRFRWALLSIALLAALVPSLIYSYRLFFHRISERSGAPAVRSLGPAALEVWKRFLESAVPTILVLSNPAVPRTAASLAWMNDASPTAPPALNPDEFTGMGEAVALHLITRLFETARHRLVVKQSRFLSQEDVERHHLILLGGRRVNPWTERLGRDLHFGSREEGFTVTNSSGGQQSVHSTEFDTNTGRLAKDLGVVALRKDKTNGHWRLFLFGVHSHGTQAAAEAATDSGFYSKIQWPGSDTLPPDGFQILIGVGVTEGQPLAVSPLVVFTGPKLKDRPFPLSP